MKAAATGLGIDGQKLMYHPQRVAAVLAGKPVTPLYAEIGLTTCCNNRCVFCSYDFRQDKRTEFPADRALSLLGELQQTGVRSVCFAGEGEPLLYPHLQMIMRQGQVLGLDLALATNGIMFSAEMIDTCCATLTWLKFSINAGSAEEYARVNGNAPEVFDAVIANVRQAVRCRQESGSKCTIGAQAVLLPENERGMPALAALMRDCGVDYFVVKPYLPNPLSKNFSMRRQHFPLSADLRDQLLALARPDFHVECRPRAFARLTDRQRGYAGCLGMRLFAFIAADGWVYACPPHYGEEEFACGNVFTQPFAEIMGSSHYRTLLARLGQENNCPIVGCRLDACNQYLWEAAHPPQHVNFI